MAPKITVLMPVYNSERYVRPAIDSILAQTYRNFEFIIVDDGSADDTAAIVERYSDPRIVCIRNPENVGVAQSLNRGLGSAQGDYIARMDGDDVSLPERLEKQVRFMDINPIIGICGTWLKTIGEPTGHIWRYPADDPTIRSQMIFGSALAHPTVMLRKESFDSAGLRYDVAYKRSQDYDLWVRAAESMRLANISEVLLYHRLHPQAASRQYAVDQQTAADHIRQSQLLRLGLNPTEDELALHRAISSLGFPITQEFILKANDWLQRLKVANAQRAIYPIAAFEAVLGQRWWLLCNSVARFGMWTWRVFSRSPLSASSQIHWRQRIKLAVKCRLAFD